MFADIEQWQHSKPVVTHSAGMVAAQHVRAARAGGAMLERGGNAVDAAVAAALALGVLEPWMCGLGGSGLMVVWLAEAQRAVTVDFQGVLADATSTENYPVDDSLPKTLMGFPSVQHNANTLGYRAISVPGAPAGFDHALRRWGTLALSDVAEPAIALAQDAPRANWFTTLQCALELNTINRDPCSRNIYLPDHGPLQPGKRMHIPNLANTLKRYAEGGAESFYRGELAEDLLFDLQQGGSSICADDLANYQIIESRAVQHEHRNTQLHTLGDSSGGTRLGEFLDAVKKLMPQPEAAPSPQSWCHYAQALNMAWKQHNLRIGRGNEENTCTSHLCTADKHGNMVALTHTLLNRFGSGVTLPKTGLLMNNAVSYFDPRPGYPTTMQPGKRINASNMCPVIATRDGCAQFALGASGGNHIMPAVAQVAALMLDFDFSLEQAMHQPRLDASDRGSVRADPALGQATLAELIKQHTVEISQQLVFPKLYACVSGVSRKNDLYIGLNDPSQPLGGASGPCTLTLDNDEANDVSGTVYA